ncbi:type II toxin-antitoxin system HipA family toxin [Devosia salina]|uniref:Type II toxin-antitoxin system HipA family toxin n=1 Tax=Devosia salina TaxID=2860336 RepID=A0ABX8WKT6_9HYPH|nr:type II toxin-antitoxin system HipA family toxin [Devosia salina]QYO78900.1 type II toxin-antitoxin system HipA family toxin [Devosia salina]
MPASIRLYGLPVGVLDVARDGNLSFRYEQGWLERTQLPHHPLSLSLPLSPNPCDHNLAGPFFGGLLPDSKQTREALARYLQVDATDDYSLLYQLGRDCPGAVTVMPLDDEVIADENVETKWDVLDDDRLARYIEALPRRPLFIDAEGELRLSLAGVHHKAGVGVVDRRIALPRGRTPSTHILKVDIDGLPDSIRVEHFCLRVAAAVGIPVPFSTIRVVKERPYMVIRRYDRVGVNGQGVFRRLHQEDFCQALGRFPRQKYEKDGGPGWQESFELMKKVTDVVAARTQLLDRATFQFLIGNPDAHAKNYSLVYRLDRIELSPLYDVNNAAAFRSFFKEQHPRLAMFVGGNRDPLTLTPEHWEAFARETDFRPRFVLRQLQDMAERMIPAAERLLAEVKGTEADSALLALAVEDIVQRCTRVRAWSA